jgi:hypothetical protein
MILKIVISCLKGHACKFCLHKLTEILIFLVNFTFDLNMALLRRMLSACGENLTQLENRKIELILNYYKLMIDEIF